MTRVHSSPNPPKRGKVFFENSRPPLRNKGTYLHSFPPPWEVPKKRKTRGILKGGRDCYDPHEGNMYTLKGGEVTTHNRYSPLVNHNDEMKEALQDTMKPPDSSPVHEEKKI